MVWLSWQPDSLDLLNTSRPSGSAFIGDSFDHSEPLTFVAGHFCFSQKSVFELYLDCLTKERQSAMK